MPRSHLVLRATISPPPEPSPLAGESWEGGRLTGSVFYGARYLGRRWWRRQHSRFDLRLEAILAMCAIAKRLIVAPATAAQGDIFPSRRTECSTAGVAQLDIAFDAQWTIVSDCDFPRHAHLPSLGVHSSDIPTDIDREKGTGLFPRLLDYITNLS